MAILTYTCGLFLLCMVPAKSTAMEPSKAPAMQSPRTHILVWLSVLSLGGIFIFLYMRGDSTRSTLVHSLLTHCRPHQPMGNQGRSVLWGNPCNYSLPSGDEERLLVVVIASGSKPVYAALRAFWRMTASLLERHGIHVYLIGRTPNITKPQERNKALIFPGNESLVPGVLEQTVDAIQYIYDQSLPGSRAKYVLRTNLSSFFNFYGLLAWLAGRPEHNFAAARIGRGLFPSGAGFVFSRDVWHMVVKHRTELDYKLIDDVAIGKLIGAKGVSITPMPRNDLAVFKTNGIPTFSCNDVHWRVKNDEVQDIAIYASLFLYFYGPPLSLLTTPQLPGS